MLEWRPFGAAALLACPAVAGGMASGPSEVSVSHHLGTFRGTSYEAWNHLNRDLRTAWCYHGSTSQPAVVTLSIPARRSLDGIGLVNGYSKSAALFAANGRVKMLGVTTDGKEVVTLLLKDAAGPPWYHFGPVGGSAIELMVAGVYRGERYPNDGTGSDLPVPPGTFTG